MKNYKKGIATIVWIIILGIIIALLVVTYYKDKEPSISGMLSEKTSEKKDTDNWKTHKSDALGIEVAHPSSFQVQEKTDTGKKEDMVILFNDGSSLHALATIRIKEINVNTILELKSYLQTRGFEADMGPQSLANQSELQVGKWNALEREILVESDWNTYEAFILLGGNRVVEINYGSVGGLNRKITKEAKKDIFDRIISSIRIYKTYEGYVVEGAEVQTFKLCHTDKAMWLSGPVAGEIVSVYRKQKKGNDPYLPIFAIIKGYIGPTSEGGGFASDYDGMFYATTLVKLSTEEKCK